MLRVSVFHLSCSGLVGELFEGLTQVADGLAGFHLRQAVYLGFSLRLLDGLGFFDVRRHAIDGGVEAEGSREPDGADFSHHTATDEVGDVDLLLARRVDDLLVEFGGDRGAEDAVDGLAVTHAEVGLAAVELLLRDGGDPLGAVALAGLPDGEAVVVVDADVVHVRVVERCDVDRARTCNNLHGRQILYQLSYYVVFGPTRNRT